LEKKGSAQEKKGKHTESSDRITGVSVGGQNRGGQGEKRIIQQTTEGKRKRLRELSRVTARQGKVTRDASLGVSTTQKYEGPGGTQTVVQTIPRGTHCLVYDHATEGSPMETRDHRAGIRAWRPKEVPGVSAQCGAKAVGER